jgi:hypothetical protein
MSSYPARDRAAVTATAILQIIRRALVAWLDRDHADFAAVRAEIETVLRDEFADVARTTLTEIRHEDG